MKRILLFLLLLMIALAIVARVRYGGGDPYPDLTTSPLLDDASLEVVLEYPEPIGNVAVSRDGRVFFTVHPESRPRGNKLLEFVNGAAVPYPDGRSQAEFFDTVLGVAIDRNGFLWTIDHGNHGIRDTRLLAFDLATTEVVFDLVFDDEVAPLGSFLQDLQISADGRTVVIADASFWRKSPALVVVDVESGNARRVLESQAAVSAQDYVITSEERAMTFAGGLLSLRGGVDGIALGPQWLYFGALSGDQLYRVPLRDLRDETLPESQLANRVEVVGRKPLSDGLSLDVDGNVYVTDVEHNAIFIVGEDHEPRTLLRSPRIRWPDALSFGADGWLYVADSALSEVVLRPQAHIHSQAPYRVFRFRPGHDGTPGQ